MACLLDIPPTEPRSIMASTACQERAWSKRECQRNTVTEMSAASLSQAQRPPDPLANLPLVRWPPLAPHLGGLDIGGALVVGLGEHAHDGDEDLLDRLNGAPPLRCVLVVVGVVTGWVEDGDADEAGGIDYARTRVSVLVTYFASASTTTAKRPTQKTGKAAFSLAAATAAWTHIRLSRPRRTYRWGARCRSGTSWTAGREGSLWGT